MSKLLNCCNVFLPLPDRVCFFQDALGCCKKRHSSLISILVFQQTDEPESFFVFQMDPTKLRGAWRGSGPVACHT